GLHRTRGRWTLPLPRCRRCVRGRHVRDARHRHSHHPDVPFPMKKAASLPLLALFGACAAPAPTPRTQPPEPSATVVAKKPPPVFSPALPAEKHLADLRQLTFEGENAEAYWSFDGQWLTMQSRLPGQGCDRIYRMSALEAGAERVPVSSGAGSTTCSYFLP